MTEQEIIDKLAEAEKDWLESKRKLAEAKKRWTDAETSLINASIHRDRVREELRVHRNTVPRHELSRRDLEIEEFRQNNPEVVEFARLRDEEKAKGDQ
jgi:hypothetical protein